MVLSTFKLGPLEPGRASTRTPGGGEDCGVVLNGWLDFHFPLGSHAGPPLTEAVAMVPLAELELSLPGQTVGSGRNEGATEGQSKWHPEVETIF